MKHATSRRLRLVRPSVPPIECTPWCEDGHGHADAEFPDDQWCFGPEVRIPLKLSDEPAVIDGGPDYFGVYLARRGPAAPVYVGVHQGGRQETPLTLPAVDALIAALNELRRIAGQS